MKPVSISEYARLQTSSRLKQFLEQRRRAAQRMDDAESIHDLRVSIRRLAQCLRTFRGLLAPAPAGKLRKRLKKLMGLCAAVRNRDVTIEVLQQAGAISEQRKSRLLSMRREAERALQERLTARHRWKKEKCLKLVRMESQKVSEWTIERSIKGNVSVILPVLADDFFAAGRAAAKRHDPESLHQFRLHAKRFRYTLELFRRFYGSELKHCLEQLRELQQYLGAINDCVTAISLLEGDADAAIAVNCLRHERELQFKSYWKHYSPRLQAEWKKWMRQPNSVID